MISEIFSTIGCQKMTEKENMFSKWRPNCSVEITECLREQNVSKTKHLWQRQPGSHLRMVPQALRILKWSSCLR